MSVGGLGWPGGPVPVGGGGGSVGGPDPAVPATAATVALGARGAEVRAVQEMLLAGGFDIGAADGIFGRGTERAVADLQRRAGLPPTGIVDGATRFAIAERAGPRISASVGARGRNDPVDVRAVQHKLASLGFYRGRPDGAYGPQLAAAIRLFDGAVRGAEQLERGASGRADAGTLQPGEDAEQWLRARNAPSWEKIPRSGTGFRNADDEGHDYATSWLVESLRSAGETYEAGYRRSHPGAPAINTNDASLRAGGDTADHETHETGMDLDVRLGNGRITYRHRAYDREATWAMVKAFLDAPNVDRVLFNDPEILRRANADPSYAGRVQSDPNGVHDNHLHVDVRPPDPEE